MKRIFSTLIVVIGILIVSSGNRIIQDNECTRVAQQCRNHIARLNEALSKVKSETGRFYLLNQIREAKIRCSERVKEACS